MDCVVATQTMPFGKFAGGVSEARVEADDIEIGMKLVDLSDGTAQGCRGDTAARWAAAAAALASGKRRRLETTDPARSQSSAASSDPGSSNNSFTSAEVSR